MFEVVIRYSGLKRAQVGRWDRGPPATYTPVNSSVRRSRTALSRPALIPAPAFLVGA